MPADYRELELARARSMRSDRLPWGDMEWIAEPKLDGWRYALHFGGDRPYLTGRRTSSVTGRFSEKGLNVPCLWPRETDHGYTVLDGEVMPPPGSGFRDLASIMNADPEEAAETMKKIGFPVYHAFDILFEDGDDVREESYLERRQRLIRVVTRLSHPLISFIETMPALETVYEGEVSRGGEGVILKSIYGTYGESGAWVKVKKYSTLDVVVTGWKDGKGKYVGQIGAAECSVYTGDGTLIPIAQVSGMTDDVRMEMSANPEQWIGTVIEIAAQEMGKDRLRHPRYRRRREDADPRACTYEKMMRDLGATKDWVVAGPQLPLF